MPTDAYAVLGVERDVSHPELRKAYLERVRSLHPDLRGETSSEEGDRELIELNEAWELVRTPDRRQAFDARASVEPEKVSAAQHQRSVTRPRAEPAPVPIGRWAFRGALVVVGLIIASMVAYSLTAPDDQDEPKPVRRSTELAVGSCVLVQPSARGLQAQEVPCTQPNSGTVREVLDYPRPCPAQLESVALVAQRLTLCLESP